MDVQRHSVHTLVFRSSKRTHDMFLADQANPPPPNEQSDTLKMRIKARDEYGPVLHLVKDKKVCLDAEEDSQVNNNKMDENADPQFQSLGEFEGRELYETDAPPPGMEVMAPSPVPTVAPSQALVLAGAQQQALITRRMPSIPKPKWHPPWKLCRVVSGHTGWVRCLAVEPGNEWFASGSNDRIIKIWDMASGKLKLSLTGHISGVRGIAISSRQPYLFSCGEDKQVKCWDLEYNKVIRHYHGHLSGVYALALHPTLDILVTGGRDSTARVWDMRSKVNIHSLSGHTNTVASVQCQATEPQVITGSHDSTVRLWDLAAGKTRATLTHHKKSIRALVIHPKTNMFASGAPDNIKKWSCPDGNFVQNVGTHKAIVNCMAINSDDVLVSGGDNGTLCFWDWRTGYNFQRLQVPVQPGSIDSEAGIFACTYDQSGCRLITAEADKTVKIFKEDDNASEETHPINWKPDILRRKRF